MKRFLLILLAGAVLFVLAGCASSSSSPDRRTSPTPMPEPTPSPSTVPEQMEHVLPAPDVFMGLEEAPENKAGSTYYLPLVKEPVAAVQEYCKLLEENYGLHKAERTDFWGSIIMEDTNLRECVKITWMAYPAGYRLVFDFGEHCGTAALEVGKNLDDVQPETEDDWEECTVCKGSGKCPECRGRGYIEESISYDYDIRRDCQNCSDGDCPNRCFKGRIYKHWISKEDDSPEARWKEEISELFKRR